MYLVRIDLEMQRPKIVQGWRTENYMRVGTALAYRSVSWYVLYHDHRIAIHIVSWPTRIVTPLCCSTTEIELRWMPQNTFDDNIGSSKGLLPSGNKPLPEPMSTQT